MLTLCGLCNTIQSWMVFISWFKSSWKSTKAQKPSFYAILIGFGARFRYVHWTIFFTSSQIIGFPRFLSTTSLFLLSLSLQCIPFNSTLMRLAVFIDVHEIETRPFHLWPSLHARFYYIVLWSASNVDITIHLDALLWHGINSKKVHDVRIAGNQILHNTFLVFFLFFTWMSVGWLSGGFERISISAILTSDYEICKSSDEIVDFFLLPLSASKHIQLGDSGNLQFKNFHILFDHNSYCFWMLCFVSLEILLEWSQK